MTTSSPVVGTGPAPSFQHPTVVQLLPQGQGPEAFPFKICVAATAAQRVTPPNKVNTNATAALRRITPLLRHIIRASFLSSRRTVAGPHSRANLLRVDTGGEKSV